MPKYHYQGRNKSGDSVTGDMEANMVADVVRQLSAKSIIPVKIDLVSHQRSSMIIHEAKYYLGLQKVDLQEIIIFSRQMYTLLGAGVPIIKSLRQIKATVHSKVLVNALDGILHNIVSGQSLAKSLQQYRHIFPPIFINLVEIGENTGHLQQTFEQLTAYLENKRINRKRMAAAMRYPMAVFISIVIAIVIMEVFVIPQFVSIFSRFKTTLPAPTRLLIFVSDLFLNHWQSMIFYLYQEFYHP